MQCLCNPSVSLRKFYEHNYKVVEVWKGKATKGMNDGGNGLCCMTNNNFNQKVRTLQVIADLKMHSTLML